MQSNRYRVFLNGPFVFLILGFSTKYFIILLLFYCLAPGGPKTATRLDPDLCSRDYGLSHLYHTQRDTYYIHQRCSFAASVFCTIYGGGPARLATRGEKAASEKTKRRGQRGGIRQR